MLILERKPKQSFQIGRSTVTVVATGRTRVKLAIDAPDDVLVVRTELGKPRELERKPARKEEQL